METATETTIDELVHLYKSEPNYQPTIDEIISNTNYAMNELVNISNQIFIDVCMLDNKRAQNYLHVVDFTRGIIDKDTIMKILDDTDIDTSSTFKRIETLRRNQKMAIDLVKIMTNTNVLNNLFRQDSDVTKSISENVAISQNPIGNPVENNIFDLSHSKPLPALNSPQSINPTGKSVENIILNLSHSNPLTALNLPQSISLIQLMNPSEQRTDSLQSINPISQIETLKNDSVYCRFYPDCITCINNMTIIRPGENYKDPSTYCLNKCIYCSSRRKDFNKISKIETKPRLTRNQLIQDEYINGDDIYFFVMLTSNIEDGPREYLELSMIKSFNQMFPPSRPARANVYITNLQSENPYLYGLIRYDRVNFPTGTRISPKSSHIKNYFISHYTGERITDRVYDVENLTKYKGKRYLTDRSIIITKYNYLIANGNPTGNPLEDFL